MTVLVEGHPVTGLLDTGATVSVLRQSVAKDLGLTVQPVAQALRVDCANGQSLKYVGYVATDVTLAGRTVPCLLLVAPDTVSQTLLLGTNVLEQLFDQDSSVPPALSTTAAAIRSRKQQLGSNGGIVANLVAKAACRVKPGHTVEVPVTRHNLLHYPSDHLLVEVSDRANLPAGVEVMPSLLPSGKPSPQCITICNRSRQHFKVSAGAFVAQIAPVTVTDSSASAAEEKLPDIGAASCTPHEKAQLAQLVDEFKDIFSQSDLDMGCHSAVRHKIDLTDERPFKQRFRRIPPHMFEEVRDHLRQLEANGVIRPSKSQFSSPVVCARKKDGRLRLCVDFRLLNNRTVKDNYSLPRVEEILDAIPQGTQYFTKLDLKSGYHQIEIEESHKERTAFTVGPLGFWEHNRLAFGLCNSPATFQRVMDHIFADMNLKNMYIYIDDLVVFSSSFAEHLEMLRKVFLRIRECGLKLAPQKCELARALIELLGFVVSREGLQTDPAKVKKVREWPTPTSPKELHSFLGFAGYYRRFVKGFASISRPLNELKGVDKRQFKWLPEHQKAFEELKECLCSAPVLAYADFTLPFEVHVDASGTGLGSVLYQRPEGRLKVIAYASRSLNKSEKNYPAHKREFLALKWAVSDKFKDYLGDPAKKFVVKTDNNPLTYVLTTAKLDATGHRWLAALSRFNFDIEYVPGSSNADADGLSRMPFRDIDSAVVAAICHSGASDTESSTESHSEAEDGTPFPRISHEQIRREQNADHVLSVWTAAVRVGKVPKLYKSPNARRHAVMKKNFEKLKFIRGALFRHSDGVDQLVLPECRKTEVLRALHDDAGHQGSDKTLSLLKERFFWPGMTAEVAKYVAECGRCVRFKKRAPVAPLVPILTTEPLELVSTDFVKVDSSSSGLRNILVITDHFTRYAKAYPTTNMSAKTTAEKLMLFFGNFGVARRLHADQGPNFESEVVQHLCKLLGVNKSHTTPYHAMGNGSCEKMNHSVINMLGTLPQTQKQRWHKYIDALLMAYNATPHESTGFSPYFLMFGRRPKLAIDAVFPLMECKKPINEVRDALDWAWEKARERDSSNKLKSKRYYDRKAKALPLHTGDRVLKRVLAFDGPHKLKDKWSEDIYQVIGKPRDSIPVYQVRPIDGGREEVLHRNLLLPVGDLRDSSESQQDVPVSITPEEALTPSTPLAEQPRERSDRPSTSSESDSPSSDSFARVPVKARLPSAGSSSSLADSESSSTASESGEEPPRRSSRARVPTGRYIEQCSSLADIQPLLAEADSLIHMIDTLLFACSGLPGIGGV